MPGAAAITNLSELTAPLAAGDFRALLDARTPYHQTGTDGGRYAGLVDWDAMVAMACSGTVPLRDLRFFMRGKRVPDSFVHDMKGLRVDAIEQLIAGGVSIVLNRAQRLFPAIDLLCSTLAAETGDNVGASTVATTGEGGAFDLHYDGYDLVVLQIDGSKRWSIYDDPAINPVHSMPIQPPRDPDMVPARFAELQPGDWLYLPAGYRHHCDTIGGRSLHLSIMFYPFCATRALELILRDAIGSPDDRAPLRFDATDEAAVEAQLKQRLIDRIGTTSLADLSRRHSALPIRLRDLDEDGDA